MSSEEIITFDYQEETAQGLNYVIDIWNFREKLEAAQVGDAATTNRFFVRGQEFSIELYIGGVEETSKDHLGLFIVSHSEEMVRATSEVSVYQAGKLSVCEMARSQGSHSATICWMAPFLMISRRILSSSSRNFRLSFLCSGGLHRHRVLCRVQHPGLDST